MTDQTTAVEEEMDLFDDAQQDFASKEDLKDRLVAIWVTGKHGKRVGTAPGSKPYDWYETVTLVLDDGPKGWSATKIVNGEDKQTMVASVAAEGPQRLDGFQYSQGGLTARLAQRVTQDDKPKTFRPMLGRINSRPNAVKGRSPAWSIAEPTPEDKVIARKHNELLAEITKEMESAGSKVAEGDEFDD